MIPVEARALLARYPLAFVATVREDGAPNVSPKGTIRVWDAEHLVFAAIASPQTVANVRRDPRVEVNVVDHFSRRGYRFRGTAEVTADAAVCEALRGEYPPDEARAYVFEEAVLIRVQEVGDLISPSYFTGRTEEQIRAEYVALSDAPGVEDATPLGVRAKILCQVCETAAATESCPLDCRYCAACADGLDRSCRNCGGPIAALAG